MQREQDVIFVYDVPMIDLNIKTITNKSKIKKEINRQLDINNVSEFQFEMYTKNNAIQTVHFILSLINKSFGEIHLISYMIIPLSLPCVLSVRMKKVLINRLKIQNRSKYRLYDENVFDIVKNFL